MIQPSDPSPRATAGPRRLLPLAGLLISVAVFGILAVGLIRPPQQAASPLTGGPAPDFALTSLAGPRISMADLRGKLVLLNFWASWCLPCREETPLLEATSRRYAGQGLRVVGVIYQDGDDAARAFEKTYGLTYTNLLDPAGRTAIDYGVLLIPESFLIDGQGIIRDRQLGPYAAAELSRKIELYLP